nr:reverse transcriptase domain-containing protein [Tanacetum cinerariifolium]
MPNNVKTYDGTGDPEDHVKIFQAAAQVERWAMPTWCHMFNSTLIGAAKVWFDELPPESINGYKDLKADFLAYFMQQKKYVKGPVEIHNIKLRDGETIEDFIERFKVKTGLMKGAPECMRIFGFMHRVNNPELTKRLNKHVLKTMEEMMTATNAFIRGETAAVSKKKGHTSIPKEILAAEAGKFKPPPPMVTSVEKRSSSKLSYLIKEIKQGRDEPKLGKKEVSAKDKSMPIYMVQPWHRMTRQKVTQSFACVREITFSPLATSRGTEGLLVIEAEIGRHMIHCMYIDGGIREIQAVPSTAHRMHKFSIDGGIVTICSTILISAECVAVTTASKKILKESEIPLQVGEKVFATIQNFEDDFHWTPEAEQAFKQLKQHLSELPMLVAPKPKEELIVYMSASQRAISVVLMTERGMIQMPVYFVSRALQGPKLNYTPMEKLVLALVYAAKRLRRFFQAHPIAVLTDQPIKQIILHPDVAGRLHKWSVMLGEHNITYRPRTSMKVQILANFLVEKPDEALPRTPVVETSQESCTLFTDGSSCVDGSGFGLILTSPEGTEFIYALRFQFTASNNEARYEALIAGLRIAAQIGVRNVHVSVDSKLVANQVLGTYVAKEENMIKYLEKTKSLVNGFANFSISQVSRSKNKKADALSKIASTSFAHLSKQVLVEVLKEKYIQEKEVATVVEEDGPTWMTPIMEYLKDGTLPEDRKEASKLRIKARQYELLKGVLYRRLFLKPWLRGTGKVKFLIVAMDYFTKWIEAKAMATITGSQVKKFVWDNIVCRSGLPGEIVLNNEIKMPTYRTVVVDAVHNDEELRLNLDLLKERREHVAIYEAKTKLKMIKYYNARVRGVTFRPGDFVLSQ